MYVIYNKDKGFYCENEDIVGGDYDFELDQFTVQFPDYESAKFNCEKGEFVLRWEG